MGVPFETRIPAMEDYGYTAEILQRYGRVLINNFISPVAGHYEKGGIGTYPERVEQKVKDCEFLMNKYPGLFRYPKKKTVYNKGELVIRFTNEKQVQLWRQQMLQKVK